MTDSSVDGGVSVTHTGSTPNPSLSVTGTTVTGATGYGIRVADAALLPSKFVGNDFSGDGVDELGLSGALAEDWSLVAADHGTAVETLTVPAATTRTFAAGTSIGFADGAGLHVDGTALVPGTAGAPVALHASAGAAGWGGIAVGAAGTLTAGHATIDGAAAALTAAAGSTVSLGTGTETSGTITSTDAASLGITGATLGGAVTATHHTQGRTVSITGSTASAPISITSDVSSGGVDDLALSGNTSTLATGVAFTVSDPLLDPDLLSENAAAGAVFQIEGVVQHDSVDGVSVLSDTIPYLVGGTQGLGLGIPADAKLSTGATISFPTGVSLDLAGVLETDGAALGAAATTWLGVKVEDGGSFAANGTTIGGAATAVEAVDGASVDLGSASSIVGGLKADAGSTFTVDASTITGAVASTDAAALVFTGNDLTGALTVGRTLDDATVDIASNTVHGSPITLTSQTGGGTANALTGNTVVGVSGAAYVVSDNRIDPSLLDGDLGTVGEDFDLEGTIIGAGSLDYTTGAARVATSSPREGSRCRSAARSRSRSRTSSPSPTGRGLTVGGAFDATAATLTAADDDWDGVTVTPTGTLSTTGATISATTASVTAQNGSTVTIAGGEFDGDVSSTSAAAFSITGTTIHGALTATNTASVRNATVDGGIAVSRSVPSAITLSGNTIPGHPLQFISTVSGGTSVTGNQVTGIASGDAAYIVSDTAFAPDAWTTNTGSAGSVFRLDGTLVSGTLATNLPYVVTTGLALPAPATVTLPASGSLAFPASVGLSLAGELDLDGTLEAAATTWPGVTVAGGGRLFADGATIAGIDATGAVTVQSGGIASIDDGTTLTGDLVAEPGSIAGVTAGSTVNGDVTSTDATALQVTTSTVNGHIAASSTDTNPADADIVILSNTVNAASGHPIVVTDASVDPHGTLLGNNLAGSADETVRINASTLRSSWVLSATDPKFVLAAGFTIAPSGTLQMRQNSALQVSSIDSITVNGTFIAGSAAQPGARIDGNPADWAGITVGDGAVFRAYGLDLDPPLGGITATDPLELTIDGSVIPGGITATRGDAEGDDAHTITVHDTDVIASPDGTNTGIVVTSTNSDPAANSVVITGNTVNGAQGAAITVTDPAIDATNIAGNTTDPDGDANADDHIVLSGGFRSGTLAAQDLAYSVPETMPITQLTITDADVDLGSDASLAVLPGGTLGVEDATLGGATTAITSTDASSLSVSSSAIEGDVTATHSDPAQTISIEDSTFIDDGSVTGLGIDRRESDHHGQLLRRDRHGGLAHRRRARPRRLRRQHRPRRARRLRHDRTTGTLPTLGASALDIHIAGSLTVGSSTTLTVPDDSTVRFDTHAGLTVSGTLLVGAGGSGVTFDGLGDLTANAGASVTATGLLVTNPIADANPHLIAATGSSVSLLGGTSIPSGVSATGANVTVNDSTVGGGVTATSGSLTVSSGASVSGGVSTTDTSVNVDHSTVDGGLSVIRTAASTSTVSITNNAITGLVSVASTTTDPTAGASVITGNTLDNDGDDALIVHDALLDPASLTDNTPAEGADVPAVTIGGVISADTMLVDNGLGWSIAGIVQLAAGVTLQVEPGAQIALPSGAGIDVARHAEGERLDGGRVRDDRGRLGLRRHQPRTDRLAHRRPPRLHRHRRDDRHRHRCDAARAERRDGGRRRGDRDRHADADRLGDGPRQRRQPEPHRGEHCGAHDHECDRERPRSSSRR